MKTKMKIATAAAVLVLAAGLLPTADASCTAGSALVTTFAPGGNNSQVWTEDWFSGLDLSGSNGFGFNNGVSYYQYIDPFAFLGAGQFLAPVSPNYRGYWWILGTGDPTSSVARGTSGSTPQDSDSGAYLFPVLQKPAIYPGGNPAYGTINYGGYLQADWQNGSVDNCPGEDAEGDAADLQYGDCLCVLLTDQYNGEGYAAVVGKTIATVAQGDTYLQRTTRGPNLTAAAPAGAPASIFDPIILKKMPKPRVTGASKLSNTQVQVNVSLDFAPAGVYNIDSCDCSPTSYVVHARNFANATLNPASPDVEPNDGPGGAWPERDITGGGWSAVAAPAAVGGATGNFTLNCTGDESIFLGAQLCYANGANPEFCTPVVSSSSVEVECGTNLATPEPPGRGKGKAVGRPDHARPERN